ncbi:Predicted Fe2+/Mn2+ transporter, VIT1/CCC1 family [Persephonella hydrogeniphila]|uniref:Predicted Fe2+/Mn2+ transporter, VIT1/CCC1 family n=1 Tax=Persephonella hydrogeniphila TaxID=198703 RepID=A0A285NHM1_9AQUI|nr:VIT1/CCC1 transporter family protein [Persephonella hydrogeniphila]SNZ08487.1 Predicted Fe2+/Mn2+ transporter, VIT1/CCC1 family [Persephonella hydrogeniphila]
MNAVKLASYFYQMEMNDYFTYMKVSESIKESKLSESIKKIALMEKEHAQFWAEFLKKRNVEPSKVKVNRLKIFLINHLSKLINPIILISFLELGESGAIKNYYNFLKTEKLSEEEREKLKKIILDEIEHETFFARQINEKGMSNIRDFVLGMNDGLVEILGAVAGLSAVYLSNPLMVGVSGLIVGMAGALSMGIGAFISVRSQRQVNEAQKEQMEIIFDVAPERAVEEYKRKLIESGVLKELAEDITSKISKNKEAISKLLIEETEENEIRSGLFTGFAYLVGVFFPVIPYFFAPNSYIALPFSILFAGLALTFVAVVISVLSGISIKKKIFEMVISAFTAAGIAYTFGSIMQSIFGIEI